MADPLHARVCGAVSVGRRVYLFGGYDFPCAGGAGPGQIWNLDVFSFEPR